MEAYWSAADSGSNCVTPTLFPPSEGEGIGWGAMKVYK